MASIPVDDAAYERLAVAIGDPEAAMASSRPTLDTAAVAQRLGAAIKDRRPFSLIRLGDGEGYLMGWPEITPRQNLLRGLYNHLGRADFAEAELRAMANHLRASVAAADIVGVFPRAEVNRFTVPRLAIARHGLAGPWTAFCRSSIHRNLQEDGCFDRLIGGLDWVGVISCHDLRAGLGRRFGIGEVAWFPVPEQALVSEEGNAADAGHYPARFEALRQDLEVPRPGAVFLIGAGFLGKIYAHWIKARGGVALDIGSTLDGWAGKPTRRYLRPGKASASEAVLDRYRL